MASTKREETMKVFVRVRPPIYKEVKYEAAVMTQGTNGISVYYENKETTNSYDHVFGELSAQEEIFEKVKPLLVDVLSGINCCIFAYGQTSSGKSHTMIGPNGGQDVQNMSPDSWGILPRSVKFLLGYLNDKAQDGILTFSVKASFLQIYNENLYDLLRDSGPMFDDRMIQTARESEKNNNNSKDSSELKIREVARAKSLASVSGVKDVYVSGLSEFRVETSDDILHILAVGTSNRMTRSTDYNFTSSRSHAILQLTFEIETQVESGQTLISRSKLNLIDLAGSEKMSTNEENPYMLSQIAAGQKHVRELTSINKSLHALGNVISALSSTNRSHVPYRDSKLTRLLQDSLGGNTRTILIACIAPTTLHTVETLSTLSFADRAKNVRLQVVKANTVIDDKLTLAKAQAEISRLKALLSHALKQLEEEKEKFPSMTLMNGEGGQDIEELLLENDRLRVENQQLRKGKKKSSALDYLAPSPRGGAMNFGGNDFDAPKSVSKTPKKAPTPVKAGFLSRVDRFGYGSQANRKNDNINESGKDNPAHSKATRAVRNKRGSATDDSDVSDNEFGGRKRRSTATNKHHHNNDHNHPSSGAYAVHSSTDSVFMQIQQRQRYELNQLLAEANAKLQQQILGSNNASDTSSKNGNSVQVISGSTDNIATSNIILANGILRRSHDESLPPIAAQSTKNSNNYNNNDNNKSNSESQKGENAPAPLHGILKNSTLAQQSQPSTSSVGNNSNNNNMLVHNNSALFLDSPGRTNDDIVAPTNRVYRKKNVPQKPLPALSDQSFLLSQQQTNQWQSLPQLYINSANNINNNNSSNTKIISVSPSNVPYGIASPTTQMSNTHITQATAKSTTAMISLQHQVQQQQKQQQAQKMTDSVVNSNNKVNNNHPVNLSGTLDDIGRSLELFSFRQNAWERIDIVDFDPNKRFYKVQYPNQAVQWLDLSKKPVRSLADEIYGS